MTDLRQGPGGQPDDLLDLARPVRDASLLELARVFGTDTPEWSKAGHELGAHFIALAIAFTARRYAEFNMVVADPIQDLIAIACAQIIAHCAASFRPVGADGKPVSPSLAAAALMQKVGPIVFSQLKQMEAGLHDFVIPFKKREDGRIEPVDFDFQVMLKGGSK